MAEAQSKMNTTLSTTSQQPQSMTGRSYSHLMMPDNHRDFFNMCSMLADSGICPKGMDKPGTVMIALELGGRLGFSVLQSLQSIAIINGRPTLWGDAALAACKGSPVFGGINEVAVGDPSKPGYKATCTVVRHGESTPTERSFTYEDAVLAGLLGKQGPWRQYPKRMFQMRARAFALRDAFPDVLSGMQIREEVEDYALDAQSGARVERVDPARVMDAKEPLTRDKFKELQAQIANTDTLSALDGIKKQIMQYDSSPDKDALVEEFKEQRKQIQTDMHAATARTLHKTGSAAVQTDDMGYDLPPEKQQ